MKHGWTSLELIENVLDKLGGENGVQRFLHKIGEYVIDVNYDLSLTEAMSASGIKSINFRINDANFPALGVGVTQIVMSTFTFKRVVTAEDALAEMHYLGFRPATVFELIAFFNQYRWRMLKGWRKIALGSTIPVEGCCNLFENHCVFFEYDHLAMTGIRSFHPERPETEFLVVREK